MLLFLQALLNGILLGGIYAVFSAGFSLIFGVMGVVNLSHGDFLMLGAFTTYWLFSLMGIDPFITLPGAMVLLFLFGFLLQRLIINRVIGAPPIMSYLCTFGIHLATANIALRFWTADYRSVTTTYSGATADLFGLVIPWLRLITFGFALLIIVGLYVLLYKTDIGRAIRATGQDREMARLTGINVNKIYTMTFAVGAAITGMAGSLISNYFVIYPQMGLSYTIIAFCVVVLGGMGYVPGALWGGLILGVIESLTATYLTAGLSIAVTFFILFLMLILKPAGILNRGTVE